MKEQTHYYLIGGEIKKGKQKPHGEDYVALNPTHFNKLDFDIDTNKWLNSLQPCSITDGELCKIKSYLAANTDTPFDLDNHFTCTIEVTDIITDNDGVVTFREVKSEANEAVEFAYFILDNYTQNTIGWHHNNWSGDLETYVNYSPKQQS